MSGDTRYCRVSAINAIGTSVVSNVALATAVDSPPRVVSAQTSGTAGRLVGAGPRRSGGFDLDAGRVGVHGHGRGDTRTPTATATRRDGEGGWVSTGADR